VYPVQEEVQQGSIWTEALKDIVKEKDKQRDIKRIFKILKKVWLCQNLEVI